MKHQPINNKLAMPQCISGKKSPRDLELSGQQWQAGSQLGIILSPLPGLASNTHGRFSNYSCCQGHGDTGVFHHRARSVKYGGLAHSTPLPSPSLPFGYQSSCRPALKHLRFSYFPPLRQLYDQESWVGWLCSSLPAIHKSIRSTLYFQGCNNEKFSPKFHKSYY